jgi:secreted PhoX family phosphatase
MVSRDTACLIVCLDLGPIGTKMVDGYKIISIHVLFVLMASFSAIAQRFQLTKEYDGTGIILPKGIRYDQLFREGEIVVNGKGHKTPSKGKHDFSCFIPKGRNGVDGFLFVSHESNDTSKTLGDGGGATIFEINKIDGRWINKGSFNAIDFSGVGGTLHNCSGVLTPWGTILCGEESPPASNVEIFRDGRGFRDTSDFNGMKRYENMGWVVEIDPVSKTALRKLYAMGRCSHEGILLMPDSVTVYLTDNFIPSVFFKFVADKPGDLTRGRLYAYRQNGTGTGGAWMQLPSDTFSLIHSREVALQRGATSFARLEWLTLVDGRIYISETGEDAMNLDTSVMKNSSWAKHIQAKKMKEISMTILLEQFLNFFLLAIPLNL